MSSNLINRRVLLAGAGVAAALAPRAVAHGGGGAPFGDVVATERFARVEKLAEGVWAVVSTPLDANNAFDAAAAATVCNGGIVAGSDRVVAIDAFLQPAGAAWLAHCAEALTGRPLTDVIVTHFHADHSGGLAGYQRGADGPEIIATDMTRKLIYERYAGPLAPVDGTPFSAPAVRPVLPTRILTDDVDEAELDLGGGRTLSLIPLSGHTPSDLAIRVNDAPVTFAGDLVWAGLFHNYVDAIPKKLRQSAGLLLEDPDQIIGTGHGYVARARDLESYLDLLDHVGDAAQTAFDAGRPPAEAAAEYAVPESLGEWTLFSPRYYETAFEAWRRELSGDGG
ncbi:MAG: MBL fold metallo-hydrolase [Pseudomonadota bacterium]